MIVGLCTVELYIATAHSLKEKRSVIKSLMERIKNKFNVSIAEIDYQDSWQRAVIGIAAVSNESIHVNQTINNVVKFIENTDQYEVVDVSIEII